MDLKEYPYAFDSIVISKEETKELIFNDQLETNSKYEENFKKITKEFTSSHNSPNYIDSENMLIERMKENIAEKQLLNPVLRKVFGCHQAKVSILRHGYFMLT